MERLLERFHPFMERFHPFMERLLERLLTRLLVLLDLDVEDILLVGSYIIIIFLL